MVYQTLTLLMQFPNMKDYLGIKPITSSRFEVGIIHVDRGFSTMLSLSPSIQFSWVIYM